MAPKSLVLAALLIVVVAAGQVPRGAGLGASSGTSTSVLVSGVVPCATGNSINVATVPVFPNAGVQLVCGGKVVASAMADGNGAFLISMVGDSVNKDFLTALLVSNLCKMVVVTPLASCDATLAGATGTLTAPVKLLGIDSGSGSLGGLGGIVGGIIGIVGGLISGILNLGTQPFSFI